VDPAPPFEASLHAPRSWTERLIGHLFLGCGLVSVATTAGIVLVLFWETVGFFTEVSLGEFLADTQWTPLFADKHFGIWPLLSGTLLTTAIAIVVAVPLGLLAAIYLSEFAGERTRRRIKPLLEILAGVPTVVYGYFALTFVTPALQQVIPGLAGFNALGAGIVMGVMILPIIASLSEDAIFAVPNGLREGAYALGAGRIATIRRVVLPSAFSGIAAAIILGLSRAIGETMIVALAAGARKNLTVDVREGAQTMTGFIAQTAGGENPVGSVDYNMLFAVGLLLFVMTLVINMVSIAIVRRYRQVY
jgi:phosphate transport system permease protein